MRTNSYLIKPHEFRFPIEILKVVKDDTTDEGIPSDIFKESYKSILKTRAKIVHISGKEIQLAEGITTIKSIRFIIRYPIHIKETIDETYKLKYNGIIHNITYARDVEESHVYMELLAEKA